MRGILTAVALVSLLMGGSAGASASTRVTDVVCGLGGQMGISPGLIDSTPQAETFGVTGNVTGGSTSCPVGGVTATIRGTLTSPSAFCNVPALYGEPATGTLFITWVDSSTSKLRASMSNQPVIQNDNLVSIKGVVRKGRYAGEHFTTRVTVELTDGERCSSTPVTSWSFASGGRRSQLLTFWHHG